MSFALYNDRAIFSVWDSRSNSIMVDEFYDESQNRGPSLKRQLHSISYWCPSCECAFLEEDEDEFIPEDHECSDEIMCPMCGCCLDDFDLDSVCPDETDDSWMFPEGHDDGEASDTMPWDR